MLPGPVLQLLLDILAEMSRGNAISIMPIHAELSTQDAANMLNISRPFLVKLLEGGQIPFHKAGSHRRVLAKDVLEYKQKIDTKRRETLDQLAIENLFQAVVLLLGMADRHRSGHHWLVEQP